MRGLLHAAFHEENTEIYRIAQGIVWALIVLSVGLLLAEAVLGTSTQLVASIDRALLVIFGVEYLLRIGSYRPPALRVFHSGPLVRLRTHVIARLRYMLRPMLLIDLVAVVAVVPELRGLRALRILRLLRTIKLFRYSNPFASILAAFEENSLMFLFGFTVLITETLIGGVSIFLVERSVNPNISSVADGVWWALVTITTVGFGDITPQTTPGRLVGGALMVGGMFTIALFAGFVGASLVNAMLSIREEQFRMGDYANHIVICGYEPTGELLLDLVQHEFDTEETRVVVFEDTERPREVGPEFLWVQGDPTKQSELDKVRLTHAAAVIVVGSRTLSPQAADARTILTTFTIRAYLDEHAAALSGRRQPLYVVAEILDSENVDHARTAGADEVIETRRVGFSMLAHTVRYHGTADTMGRLVMTGDYNAYVGVVPDLLDRPITYQKLLTELRLTQRGGLIIGLRVDGDDIFNPSKDSIVQPGSHVIYLARAPILEVPH